MSMFVVVDVDRDRGVVCGARQHHQAILRQHWVSSSCGVDIRHIATALSSRLSLPSNYRFRVTRTAYFIDDIGRGPRTRSNGRDSENDQSDV